MKNRSFRAQVISGLLLAIATLALSACGNLIYKDPEYQYSGRPVPPSGLLQRVMVSYTVNGSSGGLEILDGLRNLRTNVQNTIPAYRISGFSAAQPTTILNFPEQLRGYVLSFTDGSLLGVNYSTEASAGSVASFGAYPASVAASPDGTRFAGANASSGILTVSGSGSIGAGTYSLNLPNVDKVVINRGNSVILAMTSNSNSLYRIVVLPQTTTPVVPPGSVDCEPLLLPVYCVVPVKGTFDRPSDVYFSDDGNTAYVLNCGPECGGTTASVSALQVAPLIVTNVPTVNPLASSAPSAMQSLPVANPIPIPGGATAALSDGTNLYIAGQSLLSLNNGSLGSTPRADGLYTGYLSILNLSSYGITNVLSISDGTHTSPNMLFADDNTLWVGSTQCASGERAHQAALGVTSQSANYNCLSLIQLGITTPTSQIVPAAVTGGATVPFPNSNQNAYYYGSLNGICWVEHYHKVYTAYGGEVHAFYTGGAITDPTDPFVGTHPAAGQEIDNTYFKIQGTALNVAYIDALTNEAN